MCTGNWTPKGVADALVAIFKARPYLPIHGDTVTSGPAHGVDADLVRLTAQYLPPGERLAILQWAQARAAGRSIRNDLRTRGQSRSTFQLMCGRALGKMAVALNRAGVPLSAAAPPEKTRQRASY